MRKIAVYGKGGIGKSTMVSALSAAIASMGYRVMQIGCDPKADSSINLLSGKELVPVMTYLRQHKGPARLKDVVTEGFGGILCIEAGGPTPGMGCAGRGIITTFNLLEELEAFEKYQPDFVFYDVLGDVVCGGFAAPIREGYAEDVLIVTSGEKMALFAAGNICTAVQSFEERGYARVRGIIMNRRNIPNEAELVHAFAEEKGIPVIGDIPRDDRFQIWENQNKTVIEGDPGCDLSATIFALAEKVVKGTY